MPTGCSRRHGLGDRARTGDELASIFDTRGRELQRIAVPRDGIVLALRSKTHVRAGDRAMLLGIPVVETE